MTEKITIKMLYGALETLNTLTKNNYQLAEIFQGWELFHQHTPNIHGALVCYASSKREMWQKIHDMKTLLIIEQQNKANEFEIETKKALKAKGYYVSQYQEA